MKRDTVIAMLFVLSFVLIEFFGFMYFAGFKYMPRGTAMFVNILGIILVLCLLYFACRFLQWIIKKAFFRKK